MRMQARAAPTTWTEHAPELKAQLGADGILGPDVTPDHGVDAHVRGLAGPVNDHSEHALWAHDSPVICRAARLTSDESPHKIGPRQNALVRGDGA